MTNKHSIFVFTIFAALISSLFTLSNPVYAQFDSIDPLIIERENGKKFKIDPDFLGLAADESNIQINLDAKDTKVKLERDEDIEVSFDTPFGDPESAKVSLLDGSVAERNLLPTIEFIGDEEVFLMSGCHLMQEILKLQFQMIYRKVNTN